MHRLRKSADYITSHGVGRALRHKYYAWMEIVGWFSSSGLWFHRTAVGWLTWELTQSGTWLGGMIAAEAVPAILLTPFAGAVADRFDRLMIARITQAGLMVIAAILAILTIMERIDQYVLLVIMVCNGTVSAFWQPARQTLTAGLVPREDFAPAIAFHAIMFNLARSAGPAMAGITIGIWGVGPAFAFNAISYSAFLAVFFYIKILYAENRADQRVGLLKNFEDGLKYVYRHASLFPFLIIIFGFSFFARAWTELFPGINDLMFDGGPEELGFLLSAFGIGAILGSFWIGTFGRAQVLMKLVIAGLLISGASLFLLAVTTVVWVGVALTVAMGFGMQSMGTGGQVIVQTTVRGDMRGRVLGIWGMVIRSGPALGALFLGSMTEISGFPLMLGVAGVMTFFVTVQAIRKRETLAAGMMQAEPK